MREPFLAVFRGNLLALTAGALALLCAPASAQRVRISDLADTNFGLITSLADQRRSQSVCAFANGRDNSYSISALGSGAGSAFVLSNGSAILPYSVEWNDQPGQTSGANLSPGVALTDQVSAATNQSCSNGPSATASLIVVIRGADLAGAQQGTYTGTLTLIVAVQ